MQYLCGKQGGGSVLELFMLFRIIHFQLWNLKFCPAYFSVILEIYSNKNSSAGL